jgi:hypothetical protein
MGAKLVAIYELVTKKAGNNGRVQLTERTGVSRTQAAEIEDTDKMLKKFKETAAEIIGQNVDELL